MQRRRVDVAYVLILDDTHEHVLLVQDNGYWSLPGGAREIGEMLEQTAVREVKEETGLDVTVGGIVHITERCIRADHTLFVTFRGYGSGMHAVSNIAGALPYPVVPPGYPYVTPTFPVYDLCIPGTLLINGGYANTGYPFTGAPYGGLYPGPGFNYAVPSSGVVLYPYLNGCTGSAYGVPTFVPTAPLAYVGSPVIFNGSGWSPGVSVTLWATAPDGTNQTPTSATVASDGTLTSNIIFTSPGAWHIFAQANGMTSPISALVQVNAK